MAARITNQKTIEKKLRQVLSNPVAFIERLKIKSKSGKLIPLKMNDEQRTMIETFESHPDKHMVILKPRQIGSSTIVSAYLFWLWLTSKEPITIAILSHKLASSKHLLEMYFRFFDNLPPQLQPPLEVRNTTSMRLPTGATLLAVSAEGKGGLRSFSANYIHLSEFAFAPHASELKATAIASLNDGRLFQESTANTFGDPHHLDIMKAQKNEANLHLLFFPWYAHGEYKKKATGYRRVVFDEDEQALMDAHSLTRGQMLWRREKIEQLGYYKFIREYPATIHEAYSGSSANYFDSDCYQYIQRIPIEVEDDHINFIGPYSKDSSYAIGVDVGSGTGGDPSVIVVLDKQTYEPVCIWSSNKTSIIETCDRLVHIAGVYKNPRVLIESNSIGAALINELRHRSYTNLWKHSQKDKDWYTNVQSKFMMMEELKDALKQGAITQLDVLTQTELRGYFVNNKGNIDYPANLPTHGDRVIALALALQCLKQVKLPTNLYLPHWIKDKRQKTMATKYSFNNKRRY